MSNKIALIDYDAGNLFSVERALKAVKADYKLTDKPQDIIQADKIIIPGVGAFAVGMENLAKRGLIKPIQTAVQKGKPILGICLGMQLLMQTGKEFGNHKGLNLIEGEVNIIKTKAKLPQIGWNKVKILNYKSPLLQGVKTHEYFYFVHSFVIRPINKAMIAATTDYGRDEFCSVISYNHLYGTQFHPEKSSQAGIKIYQNFVRQVRPTP